jgi:uracil phosphoribosyltransferase
MMNKVTVCSHPLMQDVLAQLRDKRTQPSHFRELMEQAGVHLGLAALERLPTRVSRVETPLRSARVRRAGRPVALVAVLRAGLGLVPGLSRLLPGAPIGHIGLYRDEETLNPVRYYVRLPRSIRRSFVLLLDPMLATGGSATESIRILKTDGAREITLVCLVAAREGVARVQREYPDVRIVTAAVDPVLNRHGYIVPGLGDAGDRLYWT